LIPSDEAEFVDLPNYSVIVKQISLRLVGLCRSPGGEARGFGENTSRRIGGLLRSLLSEPRIHVEPELTDLLVELDEILLQLRYVQWEGNCSADLSHSLGPLLNDKFNEELAV
jgi:hypothetical protein